VTTLSGLSHEEEKMHPGINEGLLPGGLSSLSTPMVTAAPPTLDWHNVPDISYV